MSHAETSAHCGAVGNLQLGRHAVYGVRIVSSNFYGSSSFSGIDPCAEYSVTCQFRFKYIRVINHVTKKFRVVIFLKFGMAKEFFPY